MIDNGNSSGNYSLIRYEIPIRAIWVFNYVWGMCIGIQFHVTKYICVIKLADFNFNRSPNRNEWKSILCTIYTAIELLCLENGSRWLCQSNKTPCNLFINLNQNQNQINEIWLIIIIWMNIANSNTLYSHHVSSILSRKWSLESNAYTWIAEN